MRFNNGLSALLGRRRRVLWLREGKKARWCPNDRRGRGRELSSRRRGIAIRGTRRRAAIFASFANPHTRRVRRTVTLPCSQTHPQHVQYHPPAPRFHSGYTPSPMPFNAPSLQFLCVPGATGFTLQYPLPATTVLQHIRSVKIPTPYRIPYASTTLVHFRHMHVLLESLLELFPFTSATTYRKLASDNHAWHGTRRHHRHRG